MDSSSRSCHYHSYYQQHVSRESRYVRSQMFPILNFPKNPTIEVGLFKCAHLTCRRIG